jgi:hypothetical protein
MLSKQVGPSTVLTMSATAQTVNPVTTLTGVSNGQINQTLPATKVRIATNSQPAYVAFNTTATTTTSILLPSNSVEHFKLDNTSIVYPANTTTNTPGSHLITATIVTAYVSVLQAGTAGLISITPVA